MADYAPLVRRIQPLDVALTGGEALLRPDLERVAASIRLGTEIASLTVLTNGIDLTLERAQRLRDAGVDKLIVSIEGMGEETDRARRRSGLFAHIDALLPGLVGLGFRSVQLQVTITDRNAGQLLDTARYARERGVRVSYTLESPQRLEARSIGRDEKSLAVLGESIEQLAATAESWPHVVSSPEYLRNVVPFLRNEPGALPACVAGTAFLSVSPDGWIRPCAALPPLGHWTAYPFRQSPLDCPGCWSRLRGENPALFGVSRLVEMYRSSGAAPA
jgi:MoaA/NifB/PqqE/SkfB family radical SAM enzyme